MKCENHFEYWIHTLHSAIHRSVNSQIDLKSSGDANWFSVMNVIFMEVAFQENVTQSLRIKGDQRSLPVQSKRKMKSSCDAFDVNVHMEMCIILSIRWMSFINVNAKNKHDAVEVDSSRFVLQIFAD